MARIDRLYCVQFGAKGAGEIEWSLIVDEELDRMVPAAYVTPEEAEERRRSMTESFGDDYAYRVVGFEHASFVVGRE